MAARKRSGGQSKKPVPARSAPTPRGVASKPKRAPAKATRKKRTTTKRKSALAPLVELDPMAYAKSRIRDIPDFPKPGILFRDITPMLADPKAFHIALNALAERFVGEKIDAVVGIESRGFIFGGALAERLNSAFVPVRKPGKLPYKVDTVSYSLEYGENELEMHVDSISEDSSVLVVDDLLATGGTAAAAGDLVHRQGGHVAAYAFVIELDELRGREVLEPTPVFSLLHY